VIVRADEAGERIPLSVADWDDESVTVIVQDVGVSTRKLSLLRQGDFIQNLAGPLGKPSEIARFGTVAVVAGCFGIGPGYALARALKKEGNRVIVILEARNRDWLFWLDRLEKVSDKMIATCNQPEEDETSATNPLNRLLASENVDRVYAVGCTFMMMEMSSTTAPARVPTRVSLMPLMVDGTGMCGACRCIVDGKTVLGCMDGPEFDGHKVDWSLLIERMRSYLDEETAALDIWERANWHRAADRKAAARAAGQ
jgi:ferredoxin--NADP+ reductase